MNYITKFLCRARSQFNKLNKRQKYNKEGKKKLQRISKKNFCKFVKMQSLEIFIEKSSWATKLLDFFMSSGYLMILYVLLAYLLAVSFWLNTITNVVKYTQG